MKHVPGGCASVSDPSPAPTWELQATTGASGCRTQGGALNRAMADSEAPEDATPFENNGFTGVRGN
jgi:hypothetical protein